MEKFLIQHRIHELSQKEHLDSASNELLLQQYHLDKQNNIPLEQSEARELLIVGNEKLVFRIMLDTFSIYEVSRDCEEYSVGMMGLIKAVDTFDINRKVAFSTYASQVVINEILMEYRRGKKHDYAVNKIISINDPITIHRNGDVFFLEECLGVDDTTIEDIVREEDLQTIEFSLKHLRAEERVAIIYGYGLLGNEKLTQNEIAKILGVNQSYVSRIIRGGRKKLKLLSTPSSQLSAEDLRIKMKLLHQDNSEDNKDLECDDVK